MSVPTINSNKKYEKLAVVAFCYILQNTQNLAISYCCFAEDVYEKYNDLKRMCRAIVLRIELPVWRRFLLPLLSWFASAP